MEQQPQGRSTLTILAVAGLALLGYYFFFNKPAAHPGAHGHGPGQSQHERPDRSTHAATATIETPEMTVTTSTLNASVAHVYLKGARFHDKNGHRIDLVTTSREEYYPLRFELGGVRIPDDAVWDVEQPSPREVRYTWHGDGFSVTRKIEAGRGPYELWSTLTVRNDDAETRPVRVNMLTAHYVHAADEKSGFLGFGSRSPAITRGVCRSEGKTHRYDKKDLLSGQTYHRVTLAGVESSYFANVMAIDGAEAEFCTLRTSPRGGTVDSPEGTLYEIRMAYARHQLARGQSTTTRTLAYLGPKDGAALSRAGHELGSVLDLGYFSFIARGMVRLLSAIHSVVGNWGLAIVLMTVLVKIVLFPLTLAQLRSMAKMRALKPELDKINKMYGDDREKRGAATMELYRKFGINPVAGCLPAVAQLPVWWALYTSLSTNIALYHEPFGGWLQDLSSPDPFYVMPLLLGVLMWVQQRLTPTTVDPQQAKIMQWLMPIMITMFMLFLPQGLTVYMLTNSALSILQQQFTEWRIRASLARA